MALDAAELFRQLGASRDQTAVAEPLMRALARALEAVGQPGEPPRLPAPAEAIDPTTLVRRVQTQRLLLVLIGRLQAEATAPPPTPPVRSWTQALNELNTPLDTVDVPPFVPLRERLAQRLNRWHRGVLADAQGFDQLDDDGRHRLRKHIKRLRYAAEFAASVFDEASVRRYLKGLRALQERLGTLNDVAVGIALYSAEAPHDTRALFALGWLASQREAALTACRPDLNRFIAQPRFWRGKDGQASKGSKADKGGKSDKRSKATRAPRAG
jgi:hypothetical protein